MLRSVKNFLCVAAVLSALPSAWGYALLGPENEPFQVNTIGYNPVAFYYADSLPAGPKNLGEEYRRNTPTLYYAYDANFLDFFGAYAVGEIDKAFDLLNSLDKVSNYSADLSEWPLESIRENYAAEALYLWDMKSFALTAMMEQLGLANPERYVWNLHDRFLPPGAQCPNYEYLIIKRNFDPVFTGLNEYQTTSYVNGTLYSYVINEFCGVQGANPPPPSADAYEFPVDQTDLGFSSVAGGGFSLFPGLYFTTLTRDDVGGLRYLYRAKNMNTESTGPNAEVFTTNRTPQILYTSNLTLLATAALTNTAAAVQTLFPGVQVADTSVEFKNEWVSSVNAYLTNYPWDPIGTLPHIVYSTNWTLQVVTYYHHVFGNVFTVKANASGGFDVVPLTDPRFYNKLVPVTLQTTKISAAPWAPAGSGILATNYSSTTFYTNVPSGEYFLLPAGACDLAIVKMQLPIAGHYTNIISISTNFSTTGTNIAASISTSTLISQGLTHAYVVKAIICESNSIALRQGIEKIKFVRRDFDSLLGQFYHPTTNYYTLNVITNNVLVKQRVRRLVAQPDILFSARDLIPGPAALPVYNAWARNVNFNAANAYPGLAGPGTIEVSSTIIFNKNGELFYNIGPSATNLAGAAFFIEDQVQQPTWGSFDGTTNTPVVYPNGTSILDMEDQVLLQVTNPGLPDGKVGQGYSAQFSVNGGISPYTWQIVPSADYSGLPPGLSLDSTTGEISGIPAIPGSYNFIVRVTDGGQRSSDWIYGIVINP